MGLRWILFVAIAAAVRAQTPCDNVRAYSTCELTFDVPATVQNPYAAAELRVEFRSPRRRTYAMPAFWDGGSRLIVRFAPTEAGGWDYHVTSTVPGLNDKTGSFTAAASEAPGFLQAANVH